MVSRERRRRLSVYIFRRQPETVETRVFVQPHDDIDIVKKKKSNNYKDIQTNT